MPHANVEQRRTELYGQVHYESAKPQALTMP